MNRVIETLHAARERIDRNWRWTRCLMAETPDRKSVMWNHDSACRWSLCGAVRCAAGNDTAALRSTVRCIESVAGDDIVAYNSRKDIQHSDIVSLLDRCILREERLEAQR